MNVGDCLKVVTTTKDDVFGTCFYKVVRVGLAAPEKERLGEMDGVLFSMLGGTGCAARKGFEVHDSEQRVQQGVENGSIEIISEDDALRVVESLSSKESGISSGCVEID